MLRYLLPYCFFLPWCLLSFIFQVQKPRRLSCGSAPMTNLRPSTSQASGVDVLAATKDALIEIRSHTNVAELKSANYKGALFFLQAPLSLFVSGWDKIEEANSIDDLKACDGVTVKHEKLTTLFLRGLHLQGTMPKSIGNFRHLRALRINNSELSGEIPFSVGNLVGLEELWLANNHFSGYTHRCVLIIIDSRLVWLLIRRFIPQTIAKLNNLKILRLDHNKLIGEVPPGLRHLEKLEYMLLHGNALHIPEGAPVDDEGEMYYATKDAVQQFLQALPLFGAPDAKIPEIHHMRIDLEQRRFSIKSDKGVGVQSAAAGDKIEAA